MPNFVSGDENANLFVVGSLQNREHIAKIKRQHSFALDS